MRRPRVRSRVLSVVVALCGGLALSVAASAQLSGQFGLDLAARRIPTTLTDEIALDTPSEYAELEFAISSNLAVDADCGFATVTVDAAANMAGAEHGVGIVDVPLAPLPLGGIVADEARIKGEMWAAVPFESVTDVNNLPNWVVIPNGDPLFVAARLTASVEYAEFAARCLFMLQDVNFPNPNAGYVPLFYGVADQDFGLGMIFSGSWTSPHGSSVSLALGFNASQAATIIKGYSASGRVDSGTCSSGLCNYFLNGSVGGIPLCDMDLGIVCLTDARAGLSFSVSTTQTLSATLSISAMAYEDVAFGTSFTLLKGPLESTGLQLTGSIGCFDFGILLDKLELTSLSAGCDTKFSHGALTGSFSVSATGLDRGLTGLSTRLSVSQGLFSAATSVAFAERGGDFGFSSLGTQLAFRIPPGTISVQATFSRFGLTRASVSTGVTF